MTRDGRVVVDAHQVARRIAPDYERSPPAHPRALDLRLLWPALVMWAVVAGTLGTSIGARAALASVVIVVGVFTAYLGRPRHGRRSGVALLSAGVLLAVGMGLVASVAHESSRRAGPLTGWAQARGVVTVTGRVATEPILLTGFGSDRVLVRVHLDSAVGRGLRARVSAPILVTGDSAWRDLGWRDQITAVVRLRVAEPGEGVVAQASALGPPTRQADRGALLAVADHVRGALRDAVTGLPEDSRGLVPALVLGDTSATPESLTEDMRATGLTHLSAVSGANCSLILAALAGLLRGIGCPRRWRPWLLLAGLAFFVIVARPEPSVIRAATMGAIGLIGLSRSTRAAGPPALAGAIIVLLVIDPWLSRSYGFVLSALATLGLLIFVRPWGERLRRVLPTRAGWLATPLVIPVAAQATCGPVIVLLQGTVSIVSLPANLLTAPLVAPVTIGGAGLALLGSVWPWLAAHLAWLPGGPAWLIAAVAHRLAGQPWGNAPWPDGPRGAWLLAITTAFGMAVGPRLWWELRRRPTQFGLVGLLVVALTWPIGFASWPPPGWQLVACDVGQGDALVLRTGPSSGVVVDAGPEPGLVDHCLRRLGVTRIDAVILTHFHADHVDGLPGVLSGRRVARILVTGVRDPPQQVAQILAQAQGAQVPVAELAAGQRLTFGALRADVWWPARTIHEGSIPNNGSVVLDVTIGDLDALLTGDIEREAAHALLLMFRQQPAMLERVGRYDVFKSPHHGSSNLDPQLMDAISARAAVISVGADNDYGHPSAAHLAALARIGATVLRTDQRGDIALWMSDGAVMVRSRR